MSKQNTDNKRKEKKVRSETKPQETKKPILKMKEAKEVYRGSSPNTKERDAYINKKPNTRYNKFIDRFPEKSKRNKIV